MHPSFETHHPSRPADLDAAPQSLTENEVESYQGIAGIAIERKISDRLDEVPTVRELCNLEESDTSGKPIPNSLILLAAF